MPDYDPLGILGYISATNLDTTIEDHDVGHEGDHETLHDAHNKLILALSAISDGAAISPRARGADPTGAVLADDVFDDCLDQLVPGSVLVIDGLYTLERTLYLGDLVDVAVVFLGGKLKKADGSLTAANFIPVVQAGNCERLLIWRPVIDGNRAGQADWTEWNHGLMIGVDDNNDPAPCSEVIVEYPTIWNTAGDNIYVGGQSEEFFLHGGRLSDPNRDGSFGKRQGLAIVSCTGAYIDAVHFAASGGVYTPGRIAIDLEPNNSGETLDEIYVTNCRQTGVDWNAFLNVTGAGGASSYGRVVARGNRSTRYWRINPPETLNHLEMSDNYTAEAYYIANVNHLAYADNDAAGKDVDSLAGALLLLSDAPKVHGRVSGGTLVQQTGGGLTAGVIAEGAIVRLDIDGLLIGGKGSQALPKGIVVRAKGGVDPIEMDIRPCHYFSEAASMNPAVDLSGIAGAGSHIRVHPQQHWFRSVTAPLAGASKAANGPQSTSFSASTTWDPGSLADGAVASVDVAFPSGLLVTDLAIARLSTITQPGWFVSANVANTNTVRVSIMNKTGAPVDLASGTLSVHVMRLA